MGKFERNLGAKSASGTISDNKSELKNQELVVGAPGFEPGTSCAQGSCKKSISLVRQALFCVVVLGFGPSLSAFGPKWTQVFLATRQTQGRRDSMGSVMTSSGKRVLYGRDLWCLGGAGKAEPAKLPGAGIWPEAVPRKMRGRKRVLTEISEYRRQKQT
jgi:hypothetical protein